MAARAAASSRPYVFSATATTGTRGLAARERDPDRELIGAERARLRERGHDRDTAPLADAGERVAAGARRIDDADDVLTAVAQQTDRCLCVKTLEGAFGEDRDAGHDASRTAAPVPRSRPRRRTRPGSVPPTRPCSRATTPFTITASMPSA